MRLTLFVGSEHRPSESMVQRLAEHSEQARLARRLGFDGITIGNHFSYSATAWFPPFETLMRLAADAEGVSLGTCMLILPLYEPLHVAEQCVLLDAASGGHAILGVAPGWAKDEFDVMRLDHGRRTSRFEGKHFSDIETYARPAPDAQTTPADVARRKRRDCSETCCRHTPSVGRHGAPACHADDRADRR